MVQTRVQIRFSKQGDLRLISHRDLVRTLERLFRRAQIDVRQSEGFHPKPRMNFAAPLALGIAGLDEVLEVDLVQSVASEELLETLNRHSVPGLSFHAVEVLDHTRKAQAGSLSYAASLADADVERVASAVAELMARSTCIAQREHDGRSIDIRPLIEDLCVDGTVLMMKLRVSEQIGVAAKLVAIRHTEKLELSILPAESKSQK